MNKDALLRLHASLEGLSVGDAFGEQFFVDPDRAQRLVEERILPEDDSARTPEDGARSHWPYTDDTVMALSVAESLARFGRIDPDWLAADFVRRYDPSRGYGPAMHRCLDRIRRGEDWRTVAPALFEGYGSYGNGAAMRVAPVGAYFAEDLDRAGDEAALSAQVTHSHPEAVAGAVAVAVATALAHRSRLDGDAPSPAAFLDGVIARTPESRVRDRLRRTKAFTSRTSLRHAVSVLGNGTEMSAQDTVPFSLWCAACHLDHFEEALWQTVRGLGDRDTTCAIAGGVVAGFTGREGIPNSWLDSREPLGDSFIGAPEGEHPA